MSSSRETHLRAEAEAEKTRLRVPQEPESCKQKLFYATFLNVTLGPLLT